MLAALVGVVDTECGEEGFAQFVESRGSTSAWLADVDLPIERDPSLCQHQTSIGQQNGFIDVVGDEQHGWVVPLA